MPNHQDRKYTCYAIQCVKNNKVYVGITSNLEYRLEQHFSALSLGNHISKRFQHDFDKHGVKSFLAYILEEDIAHKERMEKEADYIMDYQAYLEDSGYNNITKSLEKRLRAKNGRFFKLVEGKPQKAKGEQKGA